MKSGRRILTLLLVLIMLLTFMPVDQARASENKDVKQTETAVTAISNSAFSQWAYNDLIVGDTYGIYPMSWYQKDLKKSISNAQLRVLLAGIRSKILDTDCITASNNYELELDKMTVEEVINAIYTVISSYTYTTNPGFSKNMNPVQYFKKYGIYTGKNGELALNKRCSYEQAMVMATRTVTFLCNSLDVASKGFFWEAKSNGNTVYMLGSIHLASTGIYPFSKKILEAFNKSEALVVEVNILDTSANSALDYMYYTDGTSLKDHVSAETYEKAVAIAANYGLSEDFISKMKAWALWCVFDSFSSSEGDQESEASSLNLGIDMNFLMNADLMKKPIMQIESFDKQYSIFDSFSNGLQEYLLKGTIDSVINEQNAETKEDNISSNEVLNYYLSLWKDGDVESFKSLTSSGDITQSPDYGYLAEYNNKLLTQRDKGMADYIDNLLKSEGNHTYFVVVGAAHYISDYSVLDILKGKGYEITQIK